MYDIYHTSDSMTEKKQYIGEVKRFLIYTFSISWGFWLVIIIANLIFDVLWYGEVLTWIPMLIGSLGPPIGVYMVHKKNNGWISLKSFIKSIFSGSISKNTWLIFILFTCWRFLMVWVAFNIEEPISIIYMFLNLPLFIIGGGFEEIGWRGFLQPKLEKMTNYLTSVFIVGIIWSIWHLPLWLIAGTIQSALSFTAYTVLAIILSFSFTAFYKYTNNIFLCIMSHAWFNGCMGLAVYIGSEGYLQLNLNWKVYLVFIIELIISLLLGVKYRSKERNGNVSI